MCIPKRTPSQQRAHEATMRAINRGKRNHPRHHNLRPIYLVACLACAAFAAAVMVAAAFFMAPSPAAAFSASGPEPPGPGAGNGTSGSQSGPPVAPTLAGGLKPDSPDVPPT